MTSRRQERPPLSRHILISAVVLSAECFNADLHLDRGKNTKMTARVSSFESSVRREIQVNHQREALNAKANVYLKGWRVCYRQSEPARR